MSPSHRRTSTSWTHAMPAGWSAPIPELLVLDESRLGSAVLADDPDGARLDAALAISEPSFPKQRNELSDGHRSAATRCE